MQEKRLPAWSSHSRSAQRRRSRTFIEQAMANRQESLLGIYTMHVHQPEFSDSCILPKQKCQCMKQYMGVMIHTGALLQQDCMS